MTFAEIMPRLAGKAAALAEARAGRSRLRGRTRHWGHAILLWPLFTNKER